MKEDVLNLLKSIPSGQWISVPAMASLLHAESLFDVKRAVNGLVEDGELKCTYTTCYVKGVRMSCYRLKVAK